MPDSKVGGDSLPKCRFGSEEQRQAWLPPLVSMARWIDAFSSLSDHALPWHMEAFLGSNVAVCRVPQPL